MEFFALLGFLVVIAVGVIGYNMYRRPDWTRKKLGSLTDRFKK